MLHIQIYLTRPVDQNQTLIREIRGLKGEKSRLWTLYRTFKLTLSSLAEPNIGEWRMGVPNEPQNAKRSIDAISRCSTETMEDEHDIKKAKQG